jgi:hypothetical protein
MYVFLHICIKKVESINKQKKSILQTCIKKIQQKKFKNFYLEMHFTQMSQFYF